MGKSKTPEHKHSEKPTTKSPTPSKNSNEAKKILPNPQKPPPRENIPKKTLLILPLLNLQIRLPLRRQLTLLRLHLRLKIPSLRSPARLLPLRMAAKKIAQSPKKKLPPRISAFSSGGVSIFFFLYICDFKKCLGRLCVCLV